MAKILVIVVGLFVVYWMLKRYFKGLARRDEAPPGARNEDMVQCVHCGLHLPRSESVAVRNEHFCSPEHARERERADR